MNATEIQNFIRAGRAVFTIQSVETGVHFTYRVAAGEARPGQRAPLFVSVLVAPDLYAYLGMLNGRATITRTAKAKISPDAPSFRALQWFLRQLARGSVPASVVFRHEGRCGRCARALTTPASVDTGLGPDCAAALGVPHAQRIADITCPACHGKRREDGTCSDCGLSREVRGGPSLAQVLAERRAAYGSGYPDGQD